MHLAHPPEQIDDAVDDVDADAGHGARRGFVRVGAPGVLLDRRRGIGRLLDDAALDGAEFAGADALLQLAPSRDGSGG